MVVIVQEVLLSTSQDAQCLRVAGASIVDKFVKAWNSELKESTNLCELPLKQLRCIHKV